MRLLGYDGYLRWRSQGAVKFTPPSLARQNASCCGTQLRKLVQPPESRQNSLARPIGRNQTKARIALVSLGVGIGLDQPVGIGRDQPTV